MSSLYEPAPAGQQPAVDPGRPQARLTGWMWVWIVIGILVVLVVVGFLIGIIRALESIDAALADTTSSVVGAGGDVQPLPAHIETVNNSLVEIDTSLKPIPAQADDVINSLTTIRTTLEQVDASLVDTSGSLVDTSGTLVNTSGSLVDTSGKLVDVSNLAQSILGIANEIEGVLEAAQAPSDNLGTSDIWQRVQIANSVLLPARGDTANINASLVEVNKHLESICAALQVLDLFTADC